MNNAHQEQRRRFIEDFNKLTALDMYDEVSGNQGFPLPLSTIERTPIRSNFDRAQSARLYREMGVDNRNNHPHLHQHQQLNCSINYDDSNDDTAATMMLMIRNRALKPAAKRSRRTVSAPEIPQFDIISGANNYDNDLLDFLDIDDDDQMHLTLDDCNNNYSNNNNNNNRTVRSQSFGDIIINTALPYTNTPFTSSAASEPTSREEYPFFHYMDYSRDVYMTPDVPLTAVGRVPTFLAKLHAILLRPELQHTVAWLPHGRSWKVYDAIAFEKQVIAVYFEFTKHPNSSFFRQAKLWGFLRIKQTGLDHDSYYHPRFIRGLPYLCKDVRRPPASQLPDAPPTEQEPNLTAISEIHPVPPSSNAILLDPTIQLDWFMKGKQQQQQPPKKPSTFRYPPPGKEVIAKKTSSSTSASTDYSNHTIVKRKRAPLYTDAVPVVVTDHHNTEYHIEPNEVIYNDIDGDDDEPPIDDDLGLNLDPFFSKGYHLYPFYDYIDHSTNIDMYPLQPYTEIGQEPSFPILLHAILLWQRQSKTTKPSIQWQSHGRTWKICSLTQFEVDILPMFFRNNNIFEQSNGNAVGSFFRNVTRWGFKRIDQHHHQQNCSDVGCYYHPKFLRGLPHLCKDWNMNDVPSTSSISTSQLISEDDDYNCDDRNYSNEYPEPDFTKISQLHPVPDYDANMKVEDFLGFDWLMG